MRHNNNGAAPAAAVAIAPRANGTENIDLSPRLNNVDVNSNVPKTNIAELDLASMWKASSNNRALQVRKFSDHVSERISLYFHYYNI